jgi:hypothetical protein
MSLENLTKIRAHLVSVRGELAAEIVECIESDHIAASRRLTGNLISVQEQIEVIDRAIQDQRALDKPPYNPGSFV